MNQYEICIQDLENLQKSLKDITNSAWCLIFLGQKENHGIYRFELPHNLPKNLELNSNSMRIIW